MSFAVIPGSTVANKGVCAYKRELAVTVSIVLGAAAGAYGTQVQAGQILTQQSDGTYLPAASGDAVTIGQTKILVQSVTVDGANPTPGLAGYVAGYFNIPALIGSTAQIAALGPVVEPGVLVMKQW